MKRTLFLAAIVAAFAPGVANAKAHQHHRKPVACRRAAHRRCKHHHHHQANRPSAPPPATTAALVPPGMIGIGDAPNCLTYGADPLPYLREYPNAQILRVIIAPGDRLGGNGSALPCIKDAYAAGYKIHLAVQYWNSWTAQQAADFYRQTLPQYAPYLWAVSIGNEQELGQWGPDQTGAQYSAYWRALEPIVARLAPNAIRVAGEISPWGLPFLKVALLYGLPGVQAIAAHPYAVAGTFPVFGIVRLCHALQLPLWFTEGLQGPDSWGPGSPAADLPLQQMAGATVADAWLGLTVPPPAGAPAPAWQDGSGAAT